MSWSLCTLIDDRDPGPGVAVSKSGREKRVSARSLAQLLHRIALHGEVCWASQETLAREERVSLRTVRYGLQALEAKGLITRQHRARQGVVGGRTSDAIVIVRAAVEALPSRPKVHPVHSQSAPCASQSAPGAGEYPVEHPVEQRDLVLATSADADDGQRAGQPSLQSETRVATKYRCPRCTSDPRGWRKQIRACCPELSDQLDQAEAEMKRAEPGHWRSIACALSRVAGRAIEENEHLIDFDDFDGGAAAWVASLLRSWRRSLAEVPRSNPASYLGGMAAVKGSGAKVYDAPHVAEVLDLLPCHEVAA